MPKVEKCRNFFLANSTSHFIVSYGPYLNRCFENFRYGDWKKNIRVRFSVLEDVKVNKSLFLDLSEVSHVGSAHLCSHS